MLKSLFYRIEKFAKLGRYEKKYIIRKHLNKSISSSLMINYLREKGMEVGGGTIFHDANTAIISVQRPWMVSIGEYCRITSNVVILDHDYSRSVLRMRYDNIIGECRKTVIGDNVFIGINSIILMGAHIGNNTIVAAGSVVSGRFPDDVVIGGNPAKIICTLEEHYKKRKEKYVDEGLLYAREYYKKYNRIPTVNEMGPFFPLFLERSSKALEKNGVWTKWNGDNEKGVIRSFMNTAPVFKDYNSFLMAALSKTICEEEINALIAEKV